MGFSSAEQRCFGCSMTLRHGAGFVRAWRVKDGAWTMAGIECGCDRLLKDIGETREQMIFETGKPKGREGYNLLIGLVAPKPYRPSDWRE